MHTLNSKTHVGSDIMRLYYPSYYTQQIDQCSTFFFSSCRSFLKVDGSGNAHGGRYVDCMQGCVLTRYHVAEVSVCI